LGLIPLFSHHFEEEKVVQRVKSFHR
jgi:hypothetical protein